MGAGPTAVARWLPTGGSRHRSGWRGKLILQVEEVRFYGKAVPRLPGEPEEWTCSEARWRDAVTHDLAIKKGLV